MIYIGGAGGFGRETYDALLAIFDQLAAGGESDPDVAFLDDARAGETVRGLPVLAPEQAEPGAEFVVAIGDAATRRRVVERLEAGELVPRSVIHPGAIIAPETTVAPGCVVLPLTYVSSSITLGAHVHLGAGVTIGHDAVLNDYVTVFLGANIAGDVTLGEGATVGGAAMILPGVQVGAGATIGAGSVVTRDVAPGATVKGVPAR
ncbi:NeuD/PglB/VioB family sugar acetyltransferase [Blastococcus sp. CT_GayMR20]|uniref:NeuD/PglB/VioB family sugar acetyltransferase n=1 Tax=Blastococcus sp. CT_GayMR20 TaxID=2559609 RepID=UPI001FD83411|nr:NeuD/PglB/VioB family sugar acetyltransferase [Blastococcus sp. CT_GayMR20]